LHAGLSFVRLIDRFRLCAAPSLVYSARDRSSVRTEVARARSASGGRRIARGWWVRAGPARRRPGL